jgi:hypothetical protein
MKKLVVIFILLITITSCTTTQKTSSGSSAKYWSKEPNIEKVIYKVVVENHLKVRL